MVALDPHEVADWGMTLDDLPTDLRLLANEYGEPQLRQAVGLVQSVDAAVVGGLLAANRRKVQDDILSGRTEASGFPRRLGKTRPHHRGGV